VALSERVAAANATHYSRVPPRVFFVSIAYLAVLFSAMLACLLLR
jgi:hypothetical protein